MDPEDELIEGQTETSAEGDEEDLAAVVEEDDEAAAGEEDAGDDDDAETVVTLGDEAANDDEHEELTPKARKRWAEMRIQLSQEKKARRELEQRLQVSTAKPVEVEQVSPEPTMEDEDVDYDADKFKVKFKAWHEKQTKVEEKARAVKQEQEKQQEQWNTRLTAVDKAAAAFKFRDQDEANQVFDDTFSVMQRGIILDTPDDPKTSAMLRQVLGANPATAKKLAAIQHPGKFIFALKDVIDKMKTAPKKTAPPPERVVRSSVAGAAAIDNQLERLREEARKSGDYSKVADYNRQQAQKARKRA